jgi:4-amino-4-deoxy-L-arabinose transferase-like glycosyltransferase
MVNDEPATPMRWQIRVAAVLPALLLSFMGLAVAIRLNNIGPRWTGALIGWASAWGCALVALAIWELTSGRPVFGRPTIEQPTWSRTEIVGLVTILFAATLLRVIAIEDYPVVLHNDEMSCMIAARPFLGGNPPIFGVGWFSCPNLGFFLTSLFLRVLGQTLFALRFSSAVLGVVSLLAAYLIVRRFFGIRPAMLLLVMTSPFHWHLHFSRAGFHYMQAASMTAVAIWLFTLAVDRRSPVIFAAAGVVTGIACQTYYAAWLTPFILVAWALSRGVSDRTLLRTAVKGLAMTLLFVVITMAPLLAYYTGDNYAATSRSKDVYLLSEHNQRHVAHAYGSNEPVRVLAINAVHLAGLFIGTTYDTCLQYGFRHQFIDPFLLVFFLCGLVYAATLYREPGGQLLWIWFLFTLAAGGLLTVDAPFSPRLIGIVPIVLLFASLFIDRILDLDWIRNRRWSSAGATAVVALVIAGSTWWNLNATFIRYPQEYWYHQRDFIVRLALDLEHVREIANFDEKEQFDHEAYRALIPQIDRRSHYPWQNPSAHHLKLIDKFPSRTLLIVPLTDKKFPELHERIGCQQAGTVIAPNGWRGFQWCLIK